MQSCQELGKHLDSCATRNMHSRASCMPRKRSSPTTATGFKLAPNQESTHCSPYLLTEPEPAQNSNSHIETAIQTVLPRVHWRPLQALQFTQTTLHKTKQNPQRCPVPTDGPRGLKETRTVAGALVLGSTRGWMPTLTKSALQQ